MHELSLKDQITEFLFYSAPNGGVKVEVVLNNETLWLTQDRMADMFGVQRPAISKHLKNIFESGELVEKEVVSILEPTTQHGAIEGKTQTQQVKVLQPRCGDLDGLSRKQAELKVYSEYEQFNKQQKIESDFDR